MKANRRGRLKVEGRTNQFTHYNKTEEEKGEGTKRSPQKHLMSLRTSSTPSALAYLHSSQVVGVKQGLFKVLLGVSTGVSAGRPPATAPQSRSVTALQVLLWFGWGQRQTEKAQQTI